MRFFNVKKLTSKSGHVHQSSSNSASPRPPPDALTPECEQVLRAYGNEEYAVTLAWKMNAAIHASSFIQPGDMQRLLSRTPGASYPHVVVSLAIAFMATTRVTEPVKLYQVLRLQFLLKRPNLLDRPLPWGICGGLIFCFLIIQLSSLLELRRLLVFFNFALVLLAGRQEADYHLKGRKNLIQLDLSLLESGRRFEFLLFQRCTYG